MSIDTVALKRTHAVYTLTVEVRRPHSGAYCVLTCSGRGAAGVDSLVALELAPTPVDDDVVAQFESALLAQLETAVAGLVGMQPLLQL